MCFSFNVIDVVGNERRAAAKDEKDEARGKECGVAPEARRPRAEPPESSRWSAEFRLM